MKRFTLCLLIGGFLPGGELRAAPDINSDTQLSSAGYFQLSWRDSVNQPFELQQSAHADFADAATIYSGHDQATVISGLPDGDYYYRVRSSHSRWSKPIKITVKHHTLVKALVFFALGSVMFTALVLVLLKGAGRKEE